MTPADYADLCKMLQDSDVMYAYAHAFSDEEVHAWLNNQIRRYREDGFGLWAVILKDSNEMIGQCGLTKQDFFEPVVEVGYLFQKDFWRQGYAIEAATACKEYAFTELGLDEVWSIIRDTNYSSMNVAIRNGMLVRGRKLKHYYGLDMPHYGFSVKNTTR